MPTSTLIPVLTLPYPLVLLPTARIQLPLDEAVGTRLIELVQRSDVQPVIGTVPCTSSSTIHSWGTAARVVRIVRPISQSSKRLYHVTLHGLSRIHFPDTKSQAPFSPSELIELTAEYPKADGPPSQETIVPFRAAASKLLESLAQDTTQQSRRDVYVKISHMIEEVSDDRAPWMADVIVAGINKVEYEDKLGESFVFLLHTRASPSMLYERMKSPRPWAALRWSVPIISRKASTTLLISSGLLSRGEAI